MWYRIHGQMVHLRGTKLPQPCRAVIKLADGRKEYCAAMTPCEKHTPGAQPGLFTGLTK